MERHESKYIKLHNELIEVDLNMIELITEINEKKLLTRGCCENYENYGAYIVFEYYSFIELLKNKHILKFVNDKCTKSKIYYANNGLRHMEYNEAKYNDDLKNITEIWIFITFPNSLISDFTDIIRKSTL